MAFIFPALMMAWSALCKIQGVKQNSVSPRVGCCVPGMPAIQVSIVLRPPPPPLSLLSFQPLKPLLHTHTHTYKKGLVWVGTIVFLAGAAIDWAFFGILRALIGATGVGPGGSLMAAAFACNLIAAICFSVTGCCSLGPLPGVGTSSTSCCCPENNPDTTPNLMKNPHMTPTGTNINVVSSVPPPQGYYPTPQGRVTITQTQGTMGAAKGAQV